MSFGSWSWSIGTYIFKLVTTLLNLSLKAYLKIPLSHRFNSFEAESRVGFLRKIKLLNFLYLSNIE